MVNGINRAEQNEARKKSLPEYLIEKMMQSERLTEDEEDDLHKKGLVYIPGYRKGTGPVRAYLRKYKGLTPARDDALKKARSVWAGRHPDVPRIPGYKPMTGTERKIAMPGGEI